MNKFKFNTEFELRASTKVLFPYLSSASGLQQWFCEKAINIDSHTLDLIWDGDHHLAKVVSLRLNKSVKFDFVSADGEAKDHNYLELRLDTSDLTQSTYLKVTDYSENDDVIELQELWEEFIYKLKVIVGS
jgi:START-like superfamily domain